MLSAVRDAFVNDGANGAGRLVLVVGPSGAGKDSVIGWVQAHVDRTDGVRFAPRLVTRLAPGGSADIPVTEARFEALAAAGAFALEWRANGYRYGVPCVIERWLADGATVVVNGSRENLAEARRRFPALEAVHVTAPALVLARRLALRGREPRGEALRRLARNGAAFAQVPDAALTIFNTGSLEQAGEPLLRFLRGRTGRAAAR